MKIETLLYDVLASIPIGIRVLIGLVMFLSVVSKIWGAKIKGWIGEKVTSRIYLKRLPKSDYTIYNDLYFSRPDGEGVTQVDHVVVSRYGIFVVETKNYKGRIFGGESQRQWTVALGRQKFKFQNPLHQNELHLRALSKYLKIDRSKFISIVFFVGESNFKSDLPTNVLNRGLLGYVQSYQEDLLNRDTVECVNQSLTTLDTVQDRKILSQIHLEAIQNRMSDKERVALAMGEL